MTNTSHIIKTIQTMTTNAETFKPTNFFQKDDIETINVNSSDEYTNRVSYLYLNGAHTYSIKTASDYYGNIFTSSYKDDGEVYAMSEYL